LDEAHALSDNVVLALLKATERKDALLRTEKGLTVDCRNVCWHLATTDRGKLFDAFDTRFEKLTLRLYTREEIARIIKMNYPKWDQSACDLVAKYCNRVPREALSFASAVELAHNFHATGWEDAAKRVADLKGIDEFGMTRQRLDILSALGQHPMSINGLCVTAGVKEEELRKFIMPWLLESTADQKPLVTVTSRHYITKEGLAELDKRSVPHKEGGEVLAPMDR
jgi:Holliday junction resolvasome RuvABC ATP-dependent DNA helicase subunit